MIKTQPFGGGGGASTAGTVDIELVPSVNIAQNQFITAFGTVADSNNTAHQNRIIGIALAAVNSGFAGQFRKIGKFPLVGFAAGVPLYLDGTGISTTPPMTGFICQIGYAINGSEIMIDIKEAIVL